MQCLYPKKKTMNSS